VTCNISDHETTPNINALYLRVFGLGNKHTVRSSLFYNEVL